MGYHTTLTAADFTIPETPEVLESLRSMWDDWHELKTGRRYGGDRDGAKWFSWMPEKFEYETVQAVFGHLGFETAESADGFALVGYDNKTGDENLFLARVAPFVSEGSYTNWEGEDGARYRYVVVNGVLFEQQGFVEVKWDTPHIFKPTVYHFTPGSPSSWVSVDLLHGDVNQQVITAKTPIVEDATGTATFAN